MDFSRAAAVLPQMHRNSFADIQSAKTSAAIAARDFSQLLLGITLSAAFTALAIVAAVHNFTEGPVRNIF